MSSSPTCSYGGDESEDAALPSGGYNVAYVHCTSATFAVFSTEIISQHNIKYIRNSAEGYKHFLFSQNSSVNHWCDIPRLC